ncbi:MAG: DMT family transporter [Lentisphaeria bacterium]|nr:DMT family transporter [Lentisphaeria bacterium]
MRALTFALLCLLFTSLNDFVFKLFGRKQAPMGGFVTVVGIVCVASSLFPLPVFTPFVPTLLWGLMAGFCSVAANILLSGSMTKLPVGISSTMYRLNMIPVIFAGWLLFGEELSLLHWLGMLSAIAAIFCFFPCGDNKGENIALMRVGFVQAFAAMLLRAALGILTKAGINHGASENGMLFWLSAMWIVGGVVWYLWKEVPAGQEFCCKRTAGYGLLSGLGVYMILLCTVKMLAAGNLSLTLPLAQMSFILTFLLGLIFLKDKMDAKKIAGAIFGAVAVVLLGLCSK